MLTTFRTRHVRRYDEKGMMARVEREGERRQEFDCWCEKGSRVEESLKSPREECLEAFQNHN